MNTILAVLPAIILPLLVCAIAWLIVRWSKDTHDHNDASDYDELL